jgi:hypothetical protein
MRYTENAIPLAVKTIAISRESVNNAEKQKSTDEREANPDAVIQEKPEIKKSADAYNNLTGIFFEIVNFTPVILQKPYLLFFASTSAALSMT